MSSLKHLVTPLRRPPSAEVQVPGSKSHTNRALVCAALAAGRSTLSGALDAKDTQAMLGALRSLDIQANMDTDHNITIDGCGGRLPAGPRTLNVNQSGTTGRFILPLLTLGEGPYVLDADSQLKSRPFDTLVEALRVLGATIDEDRLPTTVRQGTMVGGSVSIPGSASSQFLSGLLLSAPLFSGPTTIEITGELVSKPYVDLTLSTMATFGVNVENNDYRRFEIMPQPYKAVSSVIEPDASAASYFFAAAAITGGRVRINGLDESTVQGDLAFVDALAQMGADVTRGDGWTEVVGPEQLEGIEINMADISDTAQTLAIVATFASTPTTISGIGFIRLKETDRVNAVVTQLSALGIRAQEFDDEMKIWPGTTSGGTVETYDDHRMAMSFALLGLVHDGIEISNPGCVAKTFPNFFEVLDQLR